MRSVSRCLSLLTICILFIAATGLAQNVEEGKIPITTSSDEALNLYLQARDMQDKFLFQESRALLEQAVELDPDFALAWRDLSFAQPTFKGFFDNLNKACELVDKVSEGERLWILANEAGSNGDPVTQEEYLLELTGKYPNDERAHTVLATFYFGQQEYDKAIAEFTRATEIEPDFAPPYNMLGYSNRTLENYPEAEKAFQKYIELSPGDPNPLDSYAELLLKTGRFEESIEAYQRALEVKPDFIPSFVGIATNLTYLGRHEEARAEMSKLLEIADDIGQQRTAHFNTAMIYLDEGKYGEALSALNDGFELAKNINDAGAMANDMLNVANVLFEQGKYEEALTKFRESFTTVQRSDLSQENKATAARNFIYNGARVAIKTGDLKAAKAKSASYREQVTELGNPAQIRLSHELEGMIALAEKDYNRAADEFKQGNQQNPYNLYRLAVAYEGMGDPKTAREYCEKAAHFNPLLNLNYAFARPKAANMLNTQFKE